MFLNKLIDITISTFYGKVAWKLQQLIGKINNYCFALKHLYWISCISTYSELLNASNESLMSDLNLNKINWFFEKIGIKTINSIHAVV